MYICLFLSLSTHIHIYIYTHVYMYVYVIRIIRYAIRRTPDLASRGSHNQGQTITPHIYILFVYV